MLLIWPLGGSKRSSALVLGSVLLVLLVAAMTANCKKHATNNRSGSNQNHNHNNRNNGQRRPKKLQQSGDSEVPLSGRLFYEASGDTATGSGGGDELELSALSFNLMNSAKDRIAAVKNLIQTPNVQTSSQSQSQSNQTTTNPLQSLTLHTTTTNSTNSSNQGQCNHKGRVYANGQPVYIEDQPCLSCTCSRSILQCFLRVCPPVVSMEAHRAQHGDFEDSALECRMVKEPNQCCPTMKCDNQSQIIDTLANNNANSTTKTMDFTSPTPPLSAPATNATHHNATLTKEPNQPSSGNSSLISERSMNPNGTTTSDHQVARVSTYHSNNTTPLPPPDPTLNDSILLISSNPSHSTRSHHISNISSSTSSKSQQEQQGHNLALSKSRYDYSSALLDSLIESAYANAAQMRGLNVQGSCLINGSLYVEGSAVLTEANSYCQYCYCIRQKIMCVRPKCHLYISGCKPKYGSEYACCPTSYDCSPPDTQSTRSASEAESLLGTKARSGSTSREVVEKISAALESITRLTQMERHHNAELAGLRHADRALNNNNNNNNNLTTFGPTIEQMERNSEKLMEAIMRTVEGGAAANDSRSREDGDDVTTPSTGNDNRNEVPSDASSVHAQGNHTTTSEHQSESTGAIEQLLDDTPPTTRSSTPERTHHQSTSSATSSTTQQTNDETSTAEPGTSTPAENSTTIQRSHDDNNNFTSTSTSADGLLEPMNKLGPLMSMAQMGGAGGCLEGGRHYEIGEQIPTLDRCHHCYCGLEGVKECKIVECSLKIAHDCKPVTPKDHCCPIRYECPGSQQNQQQTNNSTHNQFQSQQQAPRTYQMMQRSNDSSSSSLADSLREAMIRYRSENSSARNMMSPQVEALTVASPPNANVDNLPMLLIPTRETNNNQHDNYNHQNQQQDKFNWPTPAGPLHEIRGLSEFTPVVETVRNLADGRRVREDGGHQMETETESSMTPNSLNEMLYNFTNSQATSASPANEPRLIGADQFGAGNLGGGGMTSVAPLTPMTPVSPPPPSPVAVQRLNQGVVANLHNDLDKFIMNINPQTKPLPTHSQVPRMAPVDYHSVQAEPETSFLDTNNNRQAQQDAPAGGQIVGIPSIEPELIGNLLKINDNYVRGFEGSSSEQGNNNNNHNVANDRATANGMASAARDRLIESSVEYATSQSGQRDSRSSVGPNEFRQGHQLAMNRVANGPSNGAAGTNHPENNNHANDRQNFASLNESPELRSGVDESEEDDGATRSHHRQAGQLLPRIRFSNMINPNGNNEASNHEFGSLITSSADSDRSPSSSASPGALRSTTTSDTRPVVVFDDDSNHHHHGNNSNPQTNPESDSSSSSSGDESESAERRTGSPGDLETTTEPGSFIAPTTGTPIGLDGTDRTPETRGWLKSLTHRFVNKFGRRLELSPKSELEGAASGGSTSQSSSSDAEPSARSGGQSLLSQFLNRVMGSEESHLLAKSDDSGTYKPLDSTQQPLIMRPLENTMLVAASSPVASHAEPSSEMASQMMNPEIISAPAIPVPIRSYGDSNIANLDDSQSGIKLHSVTRASSQSRQAEARFLHRADIDHDETIATSELPITSIAIPKPAIRLMNGVGGVQKSPWSSKSSSFNGPGSMVALDTRIAPSCYDPLTNITYKSGDKMPTKGDACQACTCVSGLPLCSQLRCPPKPAENCREDKLVEGECCRSYVCTDEANNQSLAADFKVSNQIEAAESPIYGSANRDPEVAFPQVQPRQLGGDQSSVGSRISTPNKQQFGSRQSSSLTMAVGSSSLMKPLSAEMRTLHPAMGPKSPAPVMSVAPRSPTGSPNGNLLQDTTPNSRGLPTNPIRTNDVLNSLPSHLRFPPHNMAPIVPNYLASVDSTNNNQQNRLLFSGPLVNNQHQQTMNKNPITMAAHSFWNQANSNTHHQQQQSMLFPSQLGANSQNQHLQRGGSVATQIPGYQVIMPSLAGDRNILKHPIRTINPVFKTPSTESLPKAMVSSLVNQQSQPSALHNNQAIPNWNPSSTLNQIAQRQGSSQSAFVNPLLHDESASKVAPPSSSHQNTPPRIPNSGQNPQLPPDQDQTSSLFSLAPNSMDPTGFRPVPGPPVTLKASSTVAQPSSLTHPSSQGHGALPVLADSASTKIPLVSVSDNNQQDESSSSPTFDTESLDDNNKPMERDDDVSSMEALSTPNPTSSASTSTSTNKPPSSIDHDQIKEEFGNTSNNRADPFRVSECNVFGRLYRLGETIESLSSKCKHCACTPSGVDCQTRLC